MMRRLLGILLVAGLIAGLAGGDTIRLNNGVRFDGVVKERPDGTYQVQAGKRTLVYRPSEVARIEKNEKTGAFDKEAAMARWSARDKELTELTGLTADQRRKVKALMYDLQKSEEGTRQKVREALIALHSEMDVYGYLAWRMPSVSHRLAPWVLEAMYYIDPGRTLPALRKNTEHVYYGTREKAIELLGRSRDGSSVGLIARGLADHTNDVRIAAAYALASVGAKEATPALVELLLDPDRRVANASRESLQVLWHAELSGEVPADSDAWGAFWDAQAGTVGQPIVLASLSPLIDAEHEFQDE